MMTCVMALMIVAATLTPTAAGAGDPAVLVDLEERLTSDPDNLPAGNEYRRAVIRTGAYDRALRFFESLVAAHPDSANAHLNYGFIYVDKIPAAGAITQVILAHSALGQFSRALELQPTWIGYYTRGASYLFWPRIFGLAPLGIADLEQALRIQQREARRPFHVRTYVALGDGYWKAGDLERARGVWTEGLREFPDCAPLQARVKGDATEITAIIDAAFDPSKRVDTDLSELWSDQ
jgi:tetratricopeptide (TPR) repeat protein